MKAEKNGIRFIVFTAAFLMMFFITKPLPVFADEAITYVDAEGTIQTCTDYEVVPTSVDAAPTWGEDGKETWYVVTEDSVINWNITIHGDVNLILCDGKKLSGCALVVGLDPYDEENDLPSLTIYGQEEGSGELEAVGYGDASAAIGSWCYNQTGDITICGGKISATAKGDNSAIGRGKGAFGGSVMICGGIVSASSENLPAISAESIDIGEMTVTDGSLDETGVTLDRFVKYVDPAGETAACRGFSRVPETSDHDLVWGADGRTSRYVVDKECRIDHPIYLQGDVDLILCDGASLKGCSLIVGEPDQENTPSLTIYCQQEGTGILEAVGAGEESAAIGSWCYSETGNITIVGGKIKATAEGGNAGIGGGMGSRNGSVTILGGEVDASGYQAVGNGRGGAGIAVDITDMVEAAGSIESKAVMLKTSDWIVDYIDASGETVSLGKYMIPADYEAAELDFGTAGETSWYVVKDETEINKQIFLHGNVNLILCDGASLKVNGGIVVNLHDSLTIYCQEEGTGVLEAHSGAGNSAAIGSFCFNQCGPITIYGGNIKAISESGNAAGIGGGKGNNTNHGTNYSDEDVFISIYGGKITAKGDGTDAIGNGGFGGNHIVVRTYEMKVTDGDLTGDTVTLEKCRHEEEDWAYRLTAPDTIEKTCICGKKADEPFCAKLQITQDREAGKLIAGFTDELNDVTYQWYLSNEFEEQEIEGAASAEYELPEGWEAGPHTFKVKATYEGVSAEAEITASSHAHYFTYEGSGSAITAVCDGDEEDGFCTLADNRIELKLTAPAYTVYGDAGEAGAQFENLDAFNAATGLSLSADDIRYTGRLGTVYRRSATPPTHAGNYTATVYVEGATASVDYSIQKAVLTVTANDNWIAYGDRPDHYGVTFDGFVFSESEADLLGELSYTYNYRQYGDAGNYAIIPSGLESTDYSFRYVAGRLTVIKQYLSVDWVEKKPDEPLAKLKYNAKPQAPTPVLRGVLNADDVTLTVTGAITGPGDGSAEVRLAGEKAVNYTIVGGSHCPFTIEPTELEEVTLKRTYIRSDPAQEEIDLSALLPSDASDAQWALVETSGGIGYEEGKGPAVDGTTNKLTFKLLPSDTAKDGEIRLSATGMRCYKDCTVRVILQQNPLALFEQVGKDEFVLCRYETITVDRSFQLSPKFADGAATNERVIWASTNPDVATITQDGKVTARSAGTTTIRCYSEDNYENYAECEVTVTDPATELSLDRKSYSFGTGDRVTLNASLLPLSAPGQLKWTVDDKDGAVSCVVAPDTMSAAFTAVKPGTAKVTVETTDGTKKKATCSLNVGPETVVCGVAGKGGVSAVSVGKTLGMDINWGANKPKNTDVIWTVEKLEGNGAVATVSEKGVLSALSKGKVEVKATSVANPDSSASATIAVFVPVKSVKLNATSAVVSRSADANPFVLSADIVSAVAGMEATGETIGSEPTVTYAVDPDHAGVLNVNESGEVSVTGGEGTVKNIKVYATVKAYGGFEKKLECKVTVQDTNPLKGLKLSGKAVSVGEGNVAYLTAATDPVNPDGDDGVIWESADPSIATVEDGRIVGVKTGSTVITARAKGSVTDKKGGKTNPQATCKVTVTPTLTDLSFANAEELAKKGLATGKSFTLKPLLAFSGTGKPANKDLFWESSDETIATVSQKGAVKALRSGRVTITATSTDVKNNGTPESVSVTFDTYTMVKSVKADRAKLVIGTRKGSQFGKISIASVVPVNADNPAILWTADNENVLLAAVSTQDSPAGDDFAESVPGEALLTEKGEALAVMAQSPGTVKLTGVTTDGSNKKITCTVTVRGEVTSLQLQTNAGRNGLGDVTRTSVRNVYTGNMKAGTTLTLNAVCDINYAPGMSKDKEVKKVYSAYQKVTDTTVSFRSSNTAVAVVDKSGKIKVLPGVASEAAATIYVLSADGTKSAEFRITVK